LLLAWGQLGDIMRKKMCCLLAILLIASVSRLSAEDKRCESSQSNNARSECLYKELQQAEADMQRAYQHALSLNDPDQKEDSMQPPLPKFDRKMLRENRQHIVQKLRESQRLWLEYREKACGAIADKYVAGTIAGEIVPVCKIDLTEQRTKFLLDNFAE
jgi:uncharacterized protein YecT (DUF1311 family)